jgi:hypothetical protein
VYGHASLADRTAPQVSSQSPQERWRRRPDVRIDPRVRLQDPMPFPQRRRSGRRPPAFEKAARKLGIAEVILCDEWTSAQVKAFRLLVNRSVTWADCDEELLALELQEVQESDFDLSLTGFDPGEIDGLLALEDDEKANAAPPLPETPVSTLGDLWLLGPHRVLCGDSTRADGVARLLDERKPRLMVTHPPYGIELDSEWRDRAGLNGRGPG